MNPACSDAIHPKAPKSDYIVTYESIREVAEYSRPKSGYEAIIGIPAAFTPICEGELKELDSLNLVGEGVGECQTTIIMLDNPNSVHEWLIQKGLKNIEVRISQYAAYSHDLHTHDLSRPIERGVRVNFYQAPPVSPSTANMWGIEFRPTKTIELLHYTVHMDIPRNFDEVRRVIQFHHENAV